MEIEGLDDFELDFQTYSDFPRSWNGHVINWMTHLRSALHEKIDRLPRSLSRSFIGKWIQPKSSPTWVGARRCVDFYLGQKLPTQERVVEAGDYLISGRISLSELLAPDYLDKPFQIVPFPVSIWDNAPLIIIPEGISPEIFTNSLPFILPPLNLELYPSTFGLCPQYFNPYLNTVSQEYAKAILPTLEFVQTTLIAAEQIVTPEQVKLVAASADLAIAAAGDVKKAIVEIESTLQTKAAIAEQLRLEAGRSLYDLNQRSSSPPRLPQNWGPQYYKEYIFMPWLNERKKAEAEVLALVQRAADALEAVLTDTAKLAALKQAAATASEQAKVAISKAEEVLLIAAPFLPPTAPDFDPPPLPALPQSLPLAVPIPPQILKGPSAGEQFANLIMQKIQEARSPNYIETVPKPELNSAAAAVELIASKIEEARDPNRILALIQDPNYYTIMQSVVEMFKPDGRPEPARGHYASTLASNKPAAPFLEVPLLGYKDQSTIHFHCGIRNNFTTIVEGGLILFDYLDEHFAVQPHLVHSNDIVEGLILVGIEKLDNLAIAMLGGGKLNQFLPAGIQLPAGTTQSQTSIDYQVQSLRQIAQNILATGNPNLKQVHVTFSNGGCLMERTLNQLTPEERDTIIVITTGTTQIIKSDLAHHVYNIIGDKDWPSKVCNGGVSGIEEARKNGAIVDIIPQTNTQTGIGGHFFIQDDYQEKIADYISKAIIPKYEIY